MSDLLRGPSDAAPASPPLAGVELRLVIDWLEQLARADDLDDIAADGGVTVAMVYQQEAAMQARRLRALASPVSGDGSSADADTHRAADGAVLGAEQLIGEGGQFSYRTTMTGERHIVDTATGFVFAKLPYDYRFTDNASQRWLAEKIVAALAPPAASVSPGMETLQASECTKPNGNGEGEQ